MLEVRGEDSLSYGISDFLHRPESAAVEFVLGRLYLAAVSGVAYKYQFALTLTLKHIFTYELWHKVCNAQFLANLTKQGFFRCFAIVEVTAYGCIPFPRLNVLPLRTLLKIYSTLCIEYM